MNSSSTSGARHPAALLSNVGLAGTLASAATLALNGFPRFDVIQLAAASFFAGLAMLGWVWAGVTQRLEARTATGPALLLWTMLLAYAVGSAALQQHGDAWDAVAYLVLLAPFLAHALARVRGDSVASAVFVALGASLGIAGASLLAQFVGVAFPSPIPAITNLELPLRATMDDPAAAAAWFGLAGFATIVSRPGRSGAAIAMAMAALAGLAFGATAAGVLLVVAGLAAVAVAAIAAQNGGMSVARVPAAFAIAMLLGSTAAMLTPQAPSPPTGLVIDQGPNVPYTALGQDEGLELEGFVPLIRRAATAAAIENLPFGSGAGTFPGQLGGRFDADSEAALQITSGLPEPRRAPAPLWVWAVEFGAVGILTPILAMTLLLLAAGRRSPMIAVATLGAMSALALAPGALTAAGLSCLGAVLLLGSDSDDAPSSETAGSALAAGALVLPIMAVVLVTQAQAVGWGYHQAHAVNLMENGRLQAAHTASQSALGWQERYDSLVNLALLDTLTDTDQDFDTTTARRLQRAIEIRERAPRPRFVLASAYVRTPVDDLELAAARMQRAVAMLERTIQLDPNFIRARIDHANVMLSSGDPRASLTALQQATERPVVPEARAAAFFAFGDRLAQQAGDPARAAEAYRQVLALSVDGAVIAATERRLRDMTEWMETGERPGTQGHDHGDHEGHDHGDHEGHDHGDHEGRDHGDHDHGDHEGHDHGDHED